MPDQPTRIAYFSSEYPCVSHTFIRREITGLEAKGFDITRIAIQPGASLVDDADIDELAKTSMVKPVNEYWPAVRAILRGLCIAGPGLFSGLATATRLGRKSHRGVLRHWLYLCESLSLIAHMHEADVRHVHVHFANNAATIALIASSMVNVTYSTTVHGPLEFDAPAGESLGEKVERSLFTTAITHYCSGQIKRWAPYDAWKKIHIVRCTVSPEWFDSAEPATDRCRDLVCVGRLGNEKGQVLLVDAFAKAVDAGFQGDLILIGDGEMRSIIEQSVAAHHLQDRVFLRGWCTGDEIRQIIKSCRALVLPSFAEGLPVVIMETMASMRPVLTTWITGIPELVKHREHGWLVGSGDRDALVQAMLEVGQATTQQLRTMGYNAQTQVAKHHGTAQEVEKLAELFRQNLATSNP